MFTLDSCFLRAGRCGRRSLGVHQEIHGEIISSPLANNNNTKACAAAAGETGSGCDRWRRPPAATAAPSSIKQRRKRLKPGEWEGPGAAAAAGGGGPGGGHCRRGRGCMAGWAGLTPNSRQKCLRHVGGSTADCGVIKGSVHVSHHHQGAAPFRSVKRLLNGFYDSMIFVTAAEFSFSAVPFDSSQQTTSWVVAPSCSP